MKIILYGITTDGDTFRPQNWPHRIACIFSPHEDGVCRYTPGIHIGYTDDVRYLSVENPSDEFATYLYNFANDHDLRLKTV